ncbi:MAG: contractile injection system protein, VgrG/Pvc8 family [Alphaproteobacteria bacterium]
MSVAVNEMLNIKFPGGKFDDFYVYDIVMKEEISELYEAEVLVLSDKAYTFEQLSEALQLNVTVSITQRLSKASKKRTRCFSGIVTAVEHLGVFYASDKKDCFSYRLRIEPALSKLTHITRKASYNRKTPIDVLSEVIAGQGLRANFSEDFISRRPFNSFGVFDQDEESDYAFMKRLTSMYGLSFSFKHLKTASNGLADVDLFFSAGERYPDWAEIVYSDGRSVPPVSQFDFRTENEAENIWRLDHWVMKKQDGYDGVMLQETYPNSNVGSYDWKVGKTENLNKRRVYTAHFHGYTRDVDKKSVDDDVSLILKAKYCSFQLEKDVWTGNGDNLLLTPCRMFSLAHFYGMKNTAMVSAMVTKARTHCRAKWPAVLAVAPDMGDNQEIIDISFNAMNFGTQSDKRFCPQCVIRRRNEV